MGLDTVQRSYSQGYGAEVLFSHAQVESSIQASGDLQDVLRGLVCDFGKSKGNLQRNRTFARKPKQDLKSCSPLGQDIMQVISWSSSPENAGTIPAYQTLADLKIAVSCGHEDDLGYDCDASDTMDYSASRASSGAESVAPKISLLEPTTPAQQLADDCKCCLREEVSHPAESSTLLPWDIC